MSNHKKKKKQKNPFFPTDQPASRVWTRQLENAEIAAAELFTAASWMAAR